MKILFLTTHNLATNPRLVKEIHLAAGEGHVVEVMAFEYSNWSKEINDTIIAGLKNKATIHLISAERNPFLPWLFSTVANIIAGWVLNVFPSNKLLLSVACHKRSLLLLWKLRRLKEKPKMIIGHTIGAFYPSFHFAKKHSIPFGIDIEDYHAGESDNKTLSKRIKKLSREVLPSAKYLSAASPLILEHTLKDIGEYKKEAIVINNSFSVKEFRVPVVNKDAKVKLVWFSQNIDKGRGLEYILPLLKKLESMAELHLYGNLKEDFFEAYLKAATNVSIHSPLKQVQLHQELALYDIGLAIEPNKDINNSLAISNKINAYLQAGLFIIASDTPAQKIWMKETSADGCIVNLLATDELRKIFESCIEKVQLIREEASMRFDKAKKYSWEEECKKLLHLWQLKKGNEVQVKEAMLF